ncbi:MAG: HlyD family efflux transporter periplasmic adaptor subunit [Thiobacillus sp.]
MNRQPQSTPLQGTPVLAQPRTAAQASRAVLSAEQLLQLQTELLGRKRFDEATAGLAQQLANSLRCERATLGWQERNGIKIVATSYVAEVHSRQETARLVAAAMEESLEQSVRLVHPAPETGRPLILLAHDELARRQGYAICTVPVSYEGKFIGALTMERREGEFSPQQATHIERVASMLAPALALKYESGQPLRRRMREGFRLAHQQLFNPETVASKPFIFGAAGVFLLLAGLLLMPVTHHVSAPATLEGATQRVLTAPADGFLHKAHVRPGDRVAAGQLLAELADQDLLVELRGLEAELAQHQNAQLSAQAHSDRTEYSVNQGRAEAVRARVELLQQQIERSQLRAPFAGVVIQGDLSQSIGAPIERGVELFTLSPSSGYRVMIQAEESEIAELRTGQSGRLILAALPARPLSLKIERITPLAQTDADKHYFAVYATLAGKLPTLRPGMQGYAKIEVDKRPLLVGWVQRSLNWTRLKLWSWGA